MGEWEEVKFKGKVIPIVDVDVDALHVLEVHGLKGLKKKETPYMLGISDFFDKRGCIHVVTWEDECPYGQKELKKYFGGCEFYKDGKCNAPIYEVEIIVKRKRVR